MSRCAVKGCGNGAYGLKKWKDEMCSLHGINYGVGRCICDPPYVLFTFPTELKHPEARKTWTKMMYRKDENTKKNWQPTRNSRVCSKHFVDGEPTETHPFPTEHMGHSAVSLKMPRRVILKHEPAPTPPRSRKRLPLEIIQLNSPTDRENMATSSEEGTTVCATTSTECAAASPPPCEPLESSMAHDHVYSETRPKEVIQDHQYAGTCKCCSDTCKGCLEKQLEINKMQTKIDFMEAKLIQGAVQKSVNRAMTNQVTSSDNKVRLYTGLPNAATFEGLYRHLLPQAKLIVYWKGCPKVSTKVPRKFKKPPKKPGPKRTLSIKDELLLTMMKLRLALGNDFLSDVFNISSSLCSQVLNTWVKFLAPELKPLIYWPSKEAVMRNLPDGYKVYAPKLRCIIDCTEMFIERPRDMLIQALTWSDYKRHNTLKFLVGIAPNGTISFLSEAYGGRASDRQIVQQSGFLDKIEPTDEIMADRGFPIKSDLVMKRAKLIIPPPAQGAEQMIGPGVTKTTTVANMRIHVERAIGRLKCFQIIKQTLPISLTPLANDIVIICAAVCNLLPPLVT